MKIHSKEFRVREGDHVNLKEWPTLVEPMYKSKDQHKDLLYEQVAKLSDMQRLLYASNRYAVLLIFQAMDAAGKDGAIRHPLWSHTQANADLARAVSSSRQEHEPTAVHPTSGPLRRPIIAIAWPPTCPTGFAFLHGRCEVHAP